MNVELSRRAALIMHTSIYYALSFSERRAFIKALERSRNFDALARKWQKLIVDAEEEVQKKQNEKEVIQSDNGSFIISAPVSRNEAQGGDEQDTAPFTGFRADKFTTKPGDMIQLTPEQAAKVIPYNQVYANRDKILKQLTEHMDAQNKRVQEKEEE